MGIKALCSSDHLSGSVVFSDSDSDQVLSNEILKDGGKKDD